jgi:hypothetical protein
LQDEGVVVVPPAFAAVKQPHSWGIGSSGPLTIEKTMVKGFSSLRGQPLQRSAGVDFTAVPASSHDRWLSERLHGYLIPGKLMLRL